MALSVSGSATTHWNADEQSMTFSRSVPEFADDLDADVLHAEPLAVFLAEAVHALGPLPHGLGVASAFGGALGRLLQCPWC
jgi:hypothetical protein